MNKTSIRPPVGFIPRYIFIEKRLQDIKEAIIRYMQVNRPIPLEWVKEYNDRTEELRIVNELRKIST